VLGIARGNARVRLGGAYPRGQRRDMCHAGSAAHDRAVAAIAAVPLPAADPVNGRVDPLLEGWCG
jgi:uncharacterized protein YjlB